jgi:hypothetical protein
MRRVLLVVILAAAAAVLVAGSVKIAGRDEALLVGEGPQVRDLGSGLRVVRPFAAVRKYDLTPTYDFSGEKRLTIPLRAGRRGRLECRVNGRIDRDKVAALDRQYGDGLGQKLLAPLVVRELAADVRAAAEAGRAGLDRLDTTGLAARLNQATLPLGLEIASIEVGGLALESGLPDGVARADGLRVFVLGLDGFDWKIADLVSQTHQLPNFDRLKREGSWGNLRSQEPLVSPLIWTTIATGVTPDVHGVTDFLVTDQVTGEEIPVTSTMRKAPALWNIATLFGLRSGFVGWFATYPAEEVDGFMVSDRVAYHMFDPAWFEGKPGGVSEGLVHPADLLAEIKPMLVEPRDVTDDLARYVRGAIWRESTSSSPTARATSSCATWIPPCRG